METTGLNISEDFITELAAKVINVPASLVSKTTYQSLVGTTKNIPEEGMTGWL